MCVRRRSFSILKSARRRAPTQVQSNCSPRRPKHHVRAGETSNQRARRINNLANPAKSAKPPSPVQIRAAPPNSAQIRSFVRRRRKRLLRDGLKLLRSICLQIPQHIDSLRVADVRVRQGGGLEDLHPRRAARSRHTHSFEAPSKSQWQDARQASRGGRGPRLTALQTARETRNARGETATTMEHRAGCDATFSAPKTNPLPAQRSAVERPCFLAVRSNRVLGGITAAVASAEPLLAVPTSVALA